MYIIEIKEKFDRDAAKTKVLASLAPFSKKSRVVRNELLTEYNDDEGSCLSQIPSKENSPPIRVLTARRGGLCRNY